jgi:hypothetical protein
MKINSLNKLNFFLLTVYNIKHLLPLKYFLIVNQVMKPFGLQGKVR